MSAAHRFFIRLIGLNRIVVVPIFATVSLLAQSAAGPSTPATPANTQAPASATSPAPCKHSAASEIPLSVTIQAKVTGTLDSAHLKVGKEIWVYIDNDVTYPGCTLNAGSALYARITAATSGQGLNTSELSLSFDHADCEGHRKKEMPLRLVALVGLPYQPENMLNNAPIIMHGTSRSAAITGLVAAFHDVNLNPGGSPQFVHPGIVVGIPKLKQEVEGGPGCSARISSTDRSVQLIRGMELIFVVESLP